MKLAVTNADSTSTPILTIPPNLIPPVPENHPFNGLSTEQKRMFDTFRNQELPLILNELTGTPCPEEQDFLSDECLVRYLKATKWQLDESVVRLQDTLQWRRDFRPRENRWEDMKTICAIGGQYLNGFDKKGRPLLVNVARLGGSVKNYDDSVRFSLYLMERAMMAMPKGVSQVCVLTEFSGSNMFNGYPMSVTIKYLDILGKHYPELLGQSVVVHPSWYIPVLYKLVKPFMDPVTLAKICFATSDGRQEKKAEQGTGGWIRLLDIVDASMLPVELGGDYNFVFNINEYWKAFMANHA
ncbi:CRAL/TRIO domain-containing protein [Rhizoclosmatium globosum]|uniref:CRAL/TRIO domain-containing protein n=1 Tax=Rhizoclosmatium globosum TaxID=329046 RepID=A0A1Y2C1M5_9FUNG|nr:CRAL/TRIO domain-containing protein [Rhizoclosmatium globosum]|eukprot:ORY40942.1 CRAL/TRIO domain-containing protein [Rhizoclosmatium globosum]